MATCAASTRSTTTSARHRRPFVKAVPSLRGVVIWGLCDAASAAMMYAPRDPRVRGLVLFNPWVRDTQSQAVTQIKHYYARRLVDGAFSAQAAARRSADAQFGHRTPAHVALRDRDDKTRRHRQQRALPGPHARRLACIHRPLAPRARRQRSRRARVHRGSAQTRPQWQKALANPRVRREDFAEADHTFSTRAWRDRVAALTIDWIRSTVSAADKNATQPATAR